MLSKCVAVSKLAVQFRYATVGSTPDVLWLALTPVNIAVAVLHESGTNLFAE